MSDLTPTTSSSFAYSSIIPDDSPVDEKDMPATDRAIEKLFDGIDAIYFMEGGFKAIAHELEKLSSICSELEIDELERERFKLKRQMQVVSRKMSALIVKNSLSFNRQVENYETVRTNAEQLLRITKGMRSSVEIGKRKCRALASVLASHHKKRVCLLVKRELALIATLHDSVAKATQLLQTTDIWPFLKVVVGVIDAARHFRHYSSVVQISLSLLAILRSTECQIDAAFAEQTKLFKLERYALLNTARHFLGDIGPNSVKMKKHFEASLCALSRITVLDLLRTYHEKSTEQSSDQLNDLPFDQLCQFIRLNDFLRILCKVGTGLVEILCIYHKILKFHMDEDKLALKNGHNDGTDGQQNDGTNNGRGEGPFVEDNSDSHPLIEKGVMQKALIDFAFDVFECAASQNLDCLLTNVEMSSIKFDQFIKIVDLAERFRAFGRQYFGNPSEAIQRTLVAKSRKYIEQYHAEKMEEVKMFLESETFTLCPVPVQFTLFDLPEFFFLKEIQQKQQNEDEKAVDETEENLLEAFVHGKSIRFSLFDSSAKDGTDVQEIFPYSLEQFDESPRRSVNTGRIITNNSQVSHGSSFDDGTRQSVDDDSLAPTPHNTMPNLCNSALNLLRVIGRFLQMATVLRSSAEPTVESIVMLFHCYVHSIYTFFCTDFDAQQQQQMFGTNFVSLRLRQFVQSIGRTLNNGQGETESGQESAENEEKSFCFCPSLCPALDKNDADKLFLLAERIVGIESAVFLAKQMELLRPFLEALLPKRGGSGSNLSLESFYRFLPAVFDLGNASFGCVAAKVVPCQSLLKQILATDWTTGEIHSQHSSYVDAIVKEFSQFQQKFVRLYPYVHISTELYGSIWSMHLLCTVRTLVQGYADAKKCSVEGRALQLLDVEQLCGALEEMIGLRPLPHRMFVENFVKAFYLPFEELQNWIVHHTEYSLSQTSAILNAAAAASNCSSSGAMNAKKTTTMSRIMANLLDASGIGEGSNSLFQ